MQTAKFESGWDRIAVDIEDPKIASVDMMVCGIHQLKMAYFLNRADVVRRFMMQLGITLETVEDKIRNQTLQPSYFRMWGHWDDHSDDFIFDPRPFLWTFRAYLVLDELQNGGDVELLAAALVDLPPPMDIRRNME